MVRPEMEYLPTRTNGALGAVWIKSSSSSLLFLGLESTLEMRGTSVHRGPKAPQGPAPSVVVYPPEEGEAGLASGVQDLKALVPDAAIVVFGASADLSRARGGASRGRWLSPRRHAPRANSPGTPESPNRPRGDASGPATRAGQRDDGQRAGTRPLRAWCAQDRDTRDGG